MTIPVVRRDDMMPRIGAMFFSSAYLMVNFDKEEFTIAETVPESVKQSLVGIDSVNNCTAALEVAGGDPTHLSPLPGQSGGSTAGSTTSDSSSKLSGGAIAGIVIGALAGLAIVAGIAIIFWRRRRAATHATPVELSGTGSGLPMSDKYGYHASEMDAGGESSELMHGDNRQYTAELDGTGRPIEVPAYPSQN